jgi:hypothetical protein
MFFQATPKRRRSGNDPAKILEATVIMQPAQDETITALSGMLKTSARITKVLRSSPRARQLISSFDSMRCNNALLAVFPVTRIVSYLFSDGSTQFESLSGLADLPTPRWLSRWTPSPIP